MSPSCWSQNLKKKNQEVKEIAPRATQVLLDSDELKKLKSESYIGDVWDTELKGFHVRCGVRSISFRVYYRTKDGKAKRRTPTIGTFGKLTTTQARKKAKEILAKVDLGYDPQSDHENAKSEAEREAQQTLRAYLDGPYTSYQDSKKDGEATLRRIRYAFTKWLDRPMGGITRVDVERWQTDQKKVKAKDKNKKVKTLPKPRAFNTIKRDYGALYTLLEHARERNVITVNPLKGIRLQKPALSEKDLIQKGANRRYLEHEEIKLLFHGLEAYQDEKRQQRRNSRSHGKPYLADLDQVTYVDHVVPWIKLMYYTGFRPGDLFGLRWEHISIRSAKIRKVIEKTAHKRSEPDIFPLSSPALETLKVWHQQQKEPKNGFVFPSQKTGNRMDRTAMRKPWARVRKLAGLDEKLVLYTLRHNFASQLVMSGIDLLTVSKLMAHSDIQTTIKYYGHLADDHMLDAVEAFAKIS